MFRATHRSSSGAQKLLIAAAGFTYVCGCRQLSATTYIYQQQATTRGSDGFRKHAIKSFRFGEIWKDIAPNTAYSIEQI